MNQRMLLAIAAIALATLSASAAKGTATRTFKGYVTDTYCGFNRVNQPPTKKCTLECVRDRHAKYAFFNFANQKVYVLNPQEEAAKYAGQTVVIQGTVGGHANFTTMRGPDSGAIITALSIAPAGSN